MGTHNAISSIASRSNSMEKSKGYIFFALPHGITNSLWDLENLAEIFLCWHSLQQQWWLYVMLRDTLFSQESLHFFPK